MEPKYSADQHVERLAEKLLKEGWMPEPNTAGMIRRDEESQRQAVVVWERMRLIVASRDASS